MKLFERKTRPKATLELTPLIDVIFILLLFFAVSTTLITNKQGIKLQLPEAETVNENKKGIIVSIDAKQQLYFEDKKIKVDELQNYVKTELAKDANLQIILNAHRGTPYHLVIGTMDNIRIAGCYDVVLQAKKDR